MSDDDIPVLPPPMPDDACNANELINLGRVDSKLREAMRLVEEAYKLLDSTGDLKYYLKFDVQIGWDSNLWKRLRRTYEREYKKAGVDPSSYHLAHFERYGLAIPVSMSLTGLAEEPIVS